MLRSRMKSAVVASGVVLVCGAQVVLPSVSVSAPVCAADTLVRDTAFYDTLHEVTVMGDSLKLAPVKSAIANSLGRNQEPSTKSLGEVLNQLAPNTMDVILHPFGFAERKQKKKKKRMKQILQEFDRAGATDPFILRLDSIMRLEGLK